MKLMCIILSFAILLTGCYTNTPLTKDSPPSTVEVSFRLHDGTYILSTEYQRVENGYKVGGNWSTRKTRTVRISLELSLMNKSKRLSPTSLV